MPDIFSFLSEYATFFPLAAFIGLLLAACNIPLSEDLIIITGALLSHETPNMLVFNLLAIYFGVIIGDFFVFWIGTRVRKGAKKFNFFTRMVPEKALDKMHHYLNKYGIFTFIVCRFIPFGIRNTLFFTAGFSNLKPRTFALFDIIAAMISINTLFFLTYTFGESIQKPIKIAGIVLFIVLVSGIISLIVRLIVMWRRKKAAAANDPQTSI